VIQGRNHTVKLSSKSSDAEPASRRTRADIDFTALAGDIKRWGTELGFQGVGITGTGLSQDEAWLLDWLAQGCHGEMAWMQQHGVKRSRPEALVPGTTRIISVRMDYWPAQAEPAGELLEDPARAYLSRYALGRDYHKLLRRRLQQLADRIESQVGAFGYRAFTDSAPVLEKAIARNAGLGWIGKHTNLIDERGGSWFFLGELFTDLPLPLDTPATAHCGTCRACLDVCPTQAIVAPYRLDARRCISYLTIELAGAIPEDLRPLLGNRIYGCDDCQLVCPWNRFAVASEENDFAPRHGLDSATLAELFSWDEATFLARTEGSAIRRIGHQRWLRNIAVALGNAPHDALVVAALEGRRDHASELVREHVAWALREQAGKRSAGGSG
jgi:epoxyqueuosine reductase